MEKIRGWLQYNLVLQGDGFSPIFVIIDVSDTSEKPLSNVYLIFTTSGINKNLSWYFVEGKQSHRKKKTQEMLPGNGTTWTYIQFSTFQVEATGSSCFPSHL